MKCLPNLTKYYFPYQRLVWFLLVKLPEVLSSWLESKSSCYIGVRKYNTVTMKISLRKCEGFHINYSLLK